MFATDKKKTFDGDKREAGESDGECDNLQQKITTRRLVAEDATPSSRIPDVEIYKSQRQNVSLVAGDHNAPSTDGLERGLNQFRSHSERAMSQFPRLDESLILDERVGGKDKKNRRRRRRRTKSHSDGKAIERLVAGAHHFTHRHQRRISSADPVALVPYSGRLGYFYTASDRDICVTDRAIVTRQLQENHNSRSVSERFVSPGVTLMPTPERSTDYPNGSDMNVAPGWEGKHQINGVSDSGDGAAGRGGMRQFRSASERFVTTRPHQIVMAAERGGMCHFRSASERAITTRPHQIVMDHLFGMTPRNVEHVAVLGEGGGASVLAARALAPGHRRHRSEGGNDADLVNRRGGRSSALEEMQRFAAHYVSPDNEQRTQDELTQLHKPVPGSITRVNYGATEHELVLPQSRISSQASSTDQENSSFHPMHGISVDNEPLRPRVSRSKSESETTTESLRKIPEYASFHESCRSAETPFATEQKDPLALDRKLHMRHESVDLFMLDFKGKTQPRAIRDVAFAMVFYSQLGAVLWLGIQFGPKPLMRVASSLVNEDNQPATVLAHAVNFPNITKVACVCGAFSILLSALALFAITAISTRFIQISLLFSVFMSCMWIMVGILLRGSFVTIMGGIAIFLCVGYAFVVWYRIPFAAANLHVALTGVRSTNSIWLAGSVFQAVALVWSAWWAFAFTGVYERIFYDQGRVGRAGPWVVAAFAISYYWTYQVIAHIVDVIVAGIMGVWLVKPEEMSSCCPQAARSSFLNAVVYSFGSICFGSLLVAPVQIVRQLAEQFCPETGTSSFLIVSPCVKACSTMFSCVDIAASYFNPWAFTYVGNYRYSFLEAGKKSSDLFRERGWTEIVKDDLITNVLLLVCVVIGGCTGVFGLLMENLDVYHFKESNDAGRSGAIAFAIGFVIGLLLSNVVMEVVKSAVNTVIVCYAGSPARFRSKHHELSDELREAWAHVWPGCMVEGPDIEPEGPPLVAPKSPMLGTLIV